MTVSITVTKLSGQDKKGEKPNTAKITLKFTGQLREVAVPRCNIRILTP